MKQQNDSVKELEIGKDYISKDGLIVLDRTGDTTNRGIDGNNFEYGLFCSCPYVWREATEEEVIGAFKRHLIHRYGDDWETMKIKERNPYSCSNINNGSWDVEISKEWGSWNVFNVNGMLYRKGVWVERLEEEPKITIQDAIKEKTAVHCATEKEAERILGMAHELGYKWHNGNNYKNDTEWNIYKSTMCYYLYDGSYCDYNYFKNRNYSIIPSTQIADLETEKTTEWTPAPEDIEEIEKLPIDKVTTEILDIALRMVGIQLDINIIDKVIDLVELIENKGDDVTIKDIVSLQQTWSRHSQAFKVD